MGTHPRRDRGAVSASMAGSLAVVVSVALVLLATGLPERVGTAAKGQVCRLGAADCDRPARPGPAGKAPPVAGAPVVELPRYSGNDGGRLPDLGISPHDVGPPGHEMGPWVERPIHRPQDEDRPLDCHELLQATCDFGQGIFLGARDTYNGFAEGVEFTVCIMLLCGREGFEKSRDTLFRNWTTPPHVALGQIWDGYYQVHHDDWTSGHGWRSIGRATPDLLGIVFGGKGAAQARRMGPYRPDAPDPPPAEPGPHLPGPADVPRFRRLADDRFRAVRDALRHDDPDAAWRAVDELEDARFELKVLGADRKVLDGLDRRVREARMTAMHASVRRDLGRTAEGREALAVLDRYRVRFTYDAPASKPNTFPGASPYGPAYYVRERNWIVITTPVEPHPGHVGRTALTMIHEANHARWTRERRNADIRRDSRERYVRTSVEEEADSYLRTFEAARELRGRGVVVQTDRLMRRYLRAYDEAVRNAVEREGRTLTEADRQRIGREAGRAEILAGLHNGDVSNPRTRETYPERYGREWDEYHRKRR